MIKFHDKISILVQTKENGFFQLYYDKLLKSILSL